ncbi:DUF2254 family protein [Sanguibacter inulinus]|uniref:DUF2254 family protein n=1 Tax=Sanguibacter inulinus TaxID=60922 RepID=UPI002805CBBE|nr:DUF2254 family protein [Sanguibacter inulinus]
MLEPHPGDYVLEGTALFLVHPHQRVDTALSAALRATVRVSDARPPYQDISFAVQQLTEMAVRAVSPGTNDPYTAINALDDLTAGLTRLVSRDLPSPDRADHTGTRRVHAPRTDPCDLITEVLDAMRWYAPANPGVMHATLGLLDHLAPAATSPKVRAHLIAHLDLLQEAFISHPRGLGGDLPRRGYGLF